MEPLTPPSPSPLTPQPSRKITLRSRKKFLLLIPLVILFVVVIFLYKAYFTPQPPSLPKSSAQPLPQTLTGLEIAQKTAIFLDKSIKVDGSFTTSYICKSDKSATNSAIGCFAFEQTLQTPKELAYRNGYMALAYWELFQTTKKVDYRTKAIRAITHIISKCQTDTNYCWYSLPALYRMYKDTNDKSYKDSILKTEGVALSKKEPFDLVLNNVGDFLFMYYDITQDTKYLELLENTAKQFLNNQVNIPKDNYLTVTLYKEGGIDIKEYMFWLAGEIYIPAYKATQNPIYLQAAQDIFDKAQIQNHINELNKKDNASDLNALQYLLNLAQVSSEPKKSQLLTQAQVFGQSILLSDWDIPENKKFNSDYGFLFSSDQNNNRKLTIHSAWRIDQFLKMSDKIFTIQ